MEQAIVEYDKLTEKVRQHESLIIQLMSIIAATNRKVHDLKHNNVNDLI